MTRTTLQTSRRSRGSVIVLVVAVLALLAVIGTVYLVSSRAERVNAASGHTVVNLDLAVDAANRLVAQVISESNTDAGGIVGGWNTSGGMGTQTSRTWTYPENYNDPSTISYNSAFRDQPWLAKAVYRDPTLAPNDYSMILSKAFNPTSGLYDLDYASMTVPYVNAIGDWRPGKSLGNPIQTPAGEEDAVLNMLPYSDASGIRYRIAVRVIDTNRMANLNVGLASATPTDTSGTYLTSYALAAPSPSDNTTGSSTYPRVFGTVSALFDTATTYTSTTTNLSDNPVDLDGTPGPTNAGRLGTYTNSGSAAAWQNVALQFENLAPLSADGTPVPFDLTDELELRTSGNLGSYAPAPKPPFSATFVPRIASDTSGSTIWPNNLGATTGTPPARYVYGNPRREFYTTYSYSRELRPYYLSDENPISTIAYTVTPSSNPFQFTLPQSTSNPIPASYVWPPAPARVAVDPDLTYAGNDKGADYVVIAATNMATAMEKVCGYTTNEALSFAANYLSARLSNWDAASATPPITVGTKTNAYPIVSMPEGPSHIDETGIVLHFKDDGGAGAVVRTYGSATDIKTLSGVVCLAYVAQPFLNEVAVKKTTDAGGSTTTDDVAIEIYNPYDNVALSLDDYAFQVDTGAPIPLTGGTPGNYVPPRGYYVMSANAGGAYETAVTAVPTATHGTNSAVGTATSGATLYLLRKYNDRTGAQKWVRIDKMDLGALNGMTPPGAGASADADLARSNDDNPASDAALNRWVATIDAQNTSTAQTLGKANPTVAGAGIELTDPWIAGIAVPMPTPLPKHVVSHFANIGEFNRIMRLSHIVELTGAITPPTPPANLHVGLIGDQIPAIATDATSNTNYQYCEFKIDAAFHFDFKTQASIFMSSTGPADAPPGASDFGGDFRAIKLLQCITMVDRVSNYDLDMGDLNTTRGISKIRIPGRINVNTASAEVLSTIPALSSQPALVGAIIAYRARGKSSDATIVPVAAYRSGTYDFTDATKYPGRGIRSLGELLVALKPATYGSIAERDQLWASIYNICSVNSDTYAVYFYLEAVKKHPYYTGGINFATTPTVWYGTTSGTSYTDDPSSSITNVPLLRVARRRWVAIVDSSYCNFNRSSSNFTLPKIVALKELPN